MAPKQMPAAELRERRTVSLSAFVYVFNELLGHCYAKAKSVRDIETRLFEAGERLGPRVLELVHFTDRAQKREIRLNNFLQFVANVLWKHLFEAPAKLEKVAGSGKYYIKEQWPATDRFFSAPKEMTSLKPSAFLAGVIQGLLAAGGFRVRVQYHTYRPTADAEPLAFFQVTAAAE
eukprot:gnl/Chilomastix_cuspidata/3055.p2 GENE.gnl/Chilomastix_cuspidata/3055~~gnl/Chilomastix_cuspidata/3055.p2  ORF type:complete len:176 (-),score=97.72 gnl/Chilomastix_cuspidata/3055:371-898(-)